MGAVKRTKQDWVDAAGRVLAESGPDSVGIEALARALGVTKGGFYGYFANRGELLDAVLDDWEASATTDVIDQVRAAEGDPGHRAWMASALTWGEATMNRLDLAVREWARRDADVAARLARVDAHRVAFLRELMRQLSDDDREAEVRTALAYAAAIGMRYAPAGAGLSEQARRDAVDLLITAGSLLPPWSRDVGR